MKEKAKFRQLILIIFLMIISSKSILFANTNVTFIQDLKVNYQNSPLGVETNNLKFSWKLSSNIVGQTQKAYQIIVKNSKKEVIWDSGIVEEDKSVGVRYNGPDLELESLYYWTVRVTCSDGETIESEPAYFETGTNFEGAQWIYYKNNLERENCFENHLKIHLDAMINQGGFGLEWGIKNTEHKFVWSFTPNELIMSVVRPKKVSKELGRVNLLEIDLNKFFEIDILVDADKIITLIDGTIVSELPNEYIIEAPYIALTASGRSWFSPAQKATFSNIVLTIDGRKEQITEFDGILTNNSGVLELEEKTAYQKFYQGRPIEYEKDDTKMPIFRTEKKLNGNVASARLYITSLGVYEAYINGQKIMVMKDEGKQLDNIFNPGWTDYYSYVNYQTYDVTDYIKGDSVTLGIMIGNGWYGGLAGSNGGGNLYYKIGDDLECELALLAKLVIIYENGNQEVIATNTDDWKVFTGGPIVFNDFFVGEIYDARLEKSIKGWNTVGFDDSKWDPVNIFDYQGNLISSSEATSYMLEELRLYPIFGDDTFIFDENEIIYPEGLELGALVRYSVDPTDSIELPKGKKLMVDLGQNFAGVVGISVSGAEGTMVNIRGAEMLNDGKAKEGSRGSDGPEGSLYWSGITRGRENENTWYTNHYILNEEKIQNYLPRFTFQGLRYVEISATDDIIIHKVYGQPITSATKQTLLLETNNEDVNQFFSNVLWSQRSNFLSIPTDCPQRSERLGWTGDIQVFSNTALYTFDSIAFLNNFLKILIDYAEQNGGYIPDYLPTVQKTSATNAGWSCVIIFLPWHIYNHTGDISILEECYDTLKTYMANVMRDGMRAGYGDWVAMEGTSPQFMASIYQIYDALTMAQIATILGYANDAEIYKVEAQRISNLTKDKYIDENANLLSVSADGFNRGFLINLFKDNTQTSILWALKLNLYETEQQRQKLIENLLTNIENKDGAERPDQGENTLSTGFLGVNILLQTLTENELLTKAYDLLLQDIAPSWLYEVKQSATTTWERWDGYHHEQSFGDYGMNSFNHYAYGSAAEWMIEYMAGIKKDEQNPGFKHIILQPHLDFGQQYNDQERINSVEAQFDSIYGKVVSNWNSNEGKLATYKVIIPANTTATLYLPIGNSTVNDNINIFGVRYMGIAKRYGVEVAEFKLRSGGYEFTVIDDELNVNLMNGFILPNL